MGADESGPLLSREYVADVCQPNACESSHDGKRDRTFSARAVRKRFLEGGKPGD